MSDNEKGGTLVRLGQELPLLTLAELAFSSGYFPDVKSKAQAAMKMLAGQELSIGPIQSLREIYIVQGRTALGAGLIAARIKSSGKYDYRIIALTDSGCKLAFFEGGKQIGEREFDAEDAKKAELLGKGPWKTYPRNMYFARALTNGARFYCPDVFGGPIYTREELGAETIHAEIMPVDPATGEVLEAEVVVPASMTDETASRQALLAECEDLWKRRTVFAPDFGTAIVRFRSLHKAIKTLPDSVMPDVAILDAFRELATLAELQQYRDALLANINKHEALLQKPQVVIGREADAGPAKQQEE